MTHDEHPPPSQNAVPASASGVPHLGFFLADELFGVPLTRLREVTRLTRLRRIPGASPHVAGLVNLRGEIICALDAHAILSVPSDPATQPGFLIALQDFSFPVGLVVDSIADIFSIDPEMVVPPTDEALVAENDCVIGTAVVESGIIGLLDLDRVVNR